MKKIAVMANSISLSGLSAQTIDDKYLQPITQICQALPIIVPTTANDEHIAAILDDVDGVLLTGDESNIHPSRYGAAVDPNANGGFDEQRDAVAFALTLAAVARKTPLFGICRGMQELNVALGGTLQSNIFANSHFPNHQKNTATELEARYGLAHDLKLVEGSALQMAMQGSVARVNSLHEQAINQLAPDLTAMAFSDDGIIEAIVHRKIPSIFGVQWHPEYKTAENPVSLAAFELFRQFL